MRLHGDAGVGRCARARVRPGPHGRGPTAAQRGGKLAAPGALAQEPRICACQDDDGARCAPGVDAFHTPRHNSEPCTSSGLSPTSDLQSLFSGGSCTCPHGAQAKSSANNCPRTASIRWLRRLALLSAPRAAPATVAPYLCVQQLAVVLTWHGSHPRVLAKTRAASRMLG